MSRIGWKSNSRNSTRYGRVEKGSGGRKEVRERERERERESERERGRGGGEVDCR